MEHDNTVAIAVWKILAGIGGVIGSITLAQWSIVMGMIAAAFTAVFMAMQAFVLYRDKIAGYREPGTLTRREDKTEPMPL